MIRQGIVQLVNSNAGVQAIATAGGGGNFVQLDKDVLSSGIPTWTYTVVSDMPEIALNSARGMINLRLQLDCFCLQPGGAVQLAQAIDLVLHGFVGTLPDTDTTKVDSCFRSDMRDDFEDAERAYRVMLEFEIHYYSDSF